MAARNKQMQELMNQLQMQQGGPGPQRGPQVTPGQQEGTAGMIPYQQPTGPATNPQSTQGPLGMQDAIKNMMKQRKQGQTSRKARSMTRQRGMKDPKRAFGALSKLAKNMNPQQLQQLQQGMGNIFGQNFGGLGAGNQAAEAFGNMMNPEQEKKQLQSILSGGYTKGNAPQMGKSQRRAGSQMHQLLANMGMTGPGSGMGQRPSMPQPGQPPTIGAPPMAGGTTPTLPGGPSGPMQPPMGPPPMGGPMPQPGQPPMGGPMPGGPGVMGQPSMPGGMQPPPITYGNGTTVDMSNGMPMITPGGMQGPMGMAPAMGQPHPGGLASLPPPQQQPGQPATGGPRMNNPGTFFGPQGNPQYGGNGIR